MASHPDQILLLDLYHLYLLILSQSYKKEFSLNVGLINTLLFKLIKTSHFSTIKKLCQQVFIGFVQTLKKDQND